MHNYLSVMLPCVCTTAAQISSGLLSITTVDAQRRLLDPARVTVGNASDLAAEVRCSSNYSLAAKGASNATVIWLYENGTAVSSGLRAFGTTQGDDGILRIYPATVLSGGNGTRFWCLDAESNDKLSVTLVLRKSSIQLGCMPSTEKHAHSYTSLLLLKVLHVLLK